MGPQERNPPASRILHRGRFKRETPPDGPSPAAPTERAAHLLVRPLPGARNKLRTLMEQIEEFLTVMDIALPINVQQVRFGGAF